MAEHSAPPPPPSDQSVSSAQPFSSTQSLTDPLSSAHLSSAGLSSAGLSPAPRSPGPHSPDPHSTDPHSSAPHSPGPHSPGPHSTDPHSSAPHSLAPHSPAPDPPAAQSPANMAAAAAESDAESDLTYGLKNTQVEAVAAWFVQKDQENKAGAAKEHEAANDVSVIQAYVQLMTEFRLDVNTYTFKEIHVSFQRASGKLDSEEEGAGAVKKGTLELMKQAIEEDIDGAEEDNMELSEWLKLEKNLTQKSSDMWVPEGYEKGVWNNSIKRVRIGIYREIERDRKKELIREGKGAKEAKDEAIAFRDEVKVVHYPRDPTLENLTLADDLSKAQEANMTLGEWLVRVKGQGKVKEEEGEGEAEEEEEEGGKRKAKEDNGEGNPKGKKRAKTQE